MNMQGLVREMASVTGRPEAEIVQLFHQKIGTTYSDYQALNAREGRICHENLIELFTIETSGPIYDQCYSIYIEYVSRLAR